MIKRILLLINFLLIASVVNSEITDADEKFTLLCEVEKSTGFNWKKGDWHQTNFITGQKYIIKKHDKPLSVDSPDYVYEGAIKNLMCQYGQEKDEYSYKDGCYSIKEFGEKSRVTNYSICREYWLKDKQSKSLLKSISCKMIGADWSISPNEWFHRHYVHSNLDSEPQGYTDENGKVVIPAGVKDSLVLSVGRCSEI